MAGDDQTQIFLGLVWSDPQNRHDKREEDHYLRFDTRTFEFVVDEEIEHVSGPRASSHTNLRPVVEYLKRHPERREVLVQLLPESLRLRGGGPPATS